MSHRTDRPRISSTRPLLMALSLVVVAVVAVGCDHRAREGDPGNGLTTDAGGVPGHELTTDAGGVPARRSTSALDTSAAASDPGWMATVQRRMGDSEHHGVEGSDGLSFGNRGEAVGALLTGLRVPEPRRCR